MAKLDFTVAIAAPPGRVFAFFVPRRMPYWYGAEMETCLELQGGASEFQTAVQVRITGKLKAKQLSLTAVVSRYEWGRLLEWHFQDAYGVRGIERWELEPAPIPSEPGAAGTRVRMRDEYELPGSLGRIADWLLTRHAVTRRVLGDLARLKQLAERR